MKTAVETIFVGKDRQYNRRFLQMCSHHLVDPVACTPASGLGEGPSREPGRPRSRALLHATAAVQDLRRAERLADRQVHRLRQGATLTPRAPTDVWEVFEEERPKLIPYRGRFDGFHAVPASVSKTLPASRFDNNKLLGQRQRRRPPSRGPCLCRSHRHPPGRADRRRASTPLWARRRRLRSLALCAGAGPQARRAAQRRAVQGLGAAGGAGARAAQARRLRRRRPADGQDPRRGADRRTCRPSRRPARRRWPRASIRPTSSSTSWRASAIRRAPSTILTPARCGCSTRPSPTAPATTHLRSAVPMERTEILDHDGRPEALRHERPPTTRARQRR